MKTINPNPAENRELLERILPFWNKLTEAQQETLAENTTFAKYGKNGAAAGIMNSAASFGIVLLNYGVLRISDVWGWDAVRYLWLALVGVYLLCAFVVLAINNNFRKMEAQNSETINSTGKESKNAQA